MVIGIQLGGFEYAAFAVGDERLIRKPVKSRNTFRFLPKNNFDKSIVAFLWINNP
jgi:hypothetical protein